MFRAPASSIVISSCACKAACSPMAPCRAAIRSPMYRWRWRIPCRARSCRCNSRALIEGKGDIRRDADGNLFGNASISSASGGMSRMLVVDEEQESAEEETLLTYRDFKLEANLVRCGCARLDQCGAARERLAAGRGRSAWAQSTEHADQCEVECESAGPGAFRRVRAAARQSSWANGCAGECHGHAAGAGDHGPGHRRRSWRRTFQRLGCD